MTQAAGIVRTQVMWKEGFQAVGPKVRFDPSEPVPPSQNEISRLWPRFSERVGKSLIMPAEPMD
ncbi:hypothetical protein N6H14_05305 [Paenibacillus sp. CC-CFT747]|nr:hypothetical protein N6H14_05305 [Paenibacillus sp. CC-CFT747]